MKKCIYLFIYLCFLENAFAIANIQSAPEVKKVDILVTNLVVKDSSFLHGLDSLIFNSVCPEIKDMNNLKIFTIFLTSIHIKNDG